MSPLQTPQELSAVMGRVLAAVAGKARCSCKWQAPAHLLFLISTRWAKSLWGEHWWVCRNDLLLSSLQGWSYPLLLLGFPFLPCIISRFTVRHVPRLSGKTTCLSTVLSHAEGTENGKQLHGEIPSAWDLSVPSLGMYNIKALHILPSRKPRFSITISLPGRSSSVFCGDVPGCGGFFKHFWHTCLLFSSAFRNATSPAVLSATSFSLNPTQYQHLQAKVTQSYLLSITGQKGLACLHSDTSFPKFVVQITSWLMLKVHWVWITAEGALKTSGWNQ